MPAKPPRAHPAQRLAGRRLPVDSARRRRLLEQLNKASAAAISNSLSAWTHTRLGGSIDLERLAHLLGDASDLVASGVADKTLDADARAWDFWLRFAEHLGFDPNISAQDATEAPALVIKLLSAFLMFVYPRISGRGGRQWAKPNSAFA